ncbi:hemolysin family protein [Insolitispirillum peregrinum]|uniref:CBS domain-containing protein n=1 Tax=Insolitispirillum peregrinum TaxID=80876 RepID=A0A1N7JNF4_9PROT|nr:hemolysin family protein [Insolitispirillum peregrinum]SIS50837.1 CBS domain-containing protein [Insolitispirillum peregrinum]
MNDEPSSRRPRIEAGAEETPSLLSLLKRLLPGRRSDDAVREAIEELMEESDDDTSTSSHERILLGNVLRLRDVTAYDVMIPRADIVAVEVSTPLPDLVGLIAKSGHSRLPVYRDTLDDVLGMIHIKDLLPVLSAPATPPSPSTMRSLMRRVMFVSPAIRVLDLLLDMRLKRTHMALVVDEYGGIDGLISIEDLIEQIVGDIEDEHETEIEPEMVLGADNTLIADARVLLEDFENRFGASFTEEEKDYTDTLGGLVFRMIGRVPMRGELISHPSGLEFEVVEADPRRIRRLRVRNLPGTGTADDDTPEPAPADAKE